MYRSSSLWLGILTNLLLSVILMNWLTCKQEIALGAILSLAFFIVSTTALVIYKQHFAVQRVEAVPAIEKTVENNQIAFLKDQLKNCLQYGDTEKADEISQRLVALSQESRGNHVSS